MRVNVVWTGLKFKKKKKALGSGVLSRFFLIALLLRK